MEANFDSPADGESLWGPRVPVTIDTNAGIMQAGDAARPIDMLGDISMALSSYLSMVYELRSMTTGVISLRQEDIDVLADAFEMEETDIAERLARLMHCDDLQTRRFVQMVKRGRVLVPISMVAAGALLAATLAFAPGESSQKITHAHAAAPIETVVTTTTPQPVSVQLGDASQVVRVDTTEPVTVAEESNSETATTTPLPGPGEVIIGDAATITRGDE
jgi:hypothetical protein